ncbi:MAG: FkbM family methyltransferase [Flavobacteriales bacterium]|nr:FkbM family methyltransferase [Flavobacteriales bacterium]
MLLEKIVNTEEFLQDRIVRTINEVKKPVVIYGASVYAYVVYNYLRAKGIEVFNLAVDRQYKQADHYMGIEVIEIESILDSIDDYHVVIGISNYPAVIERFKSKGIDSLMVLDVPDFLNIPDAFMDLEFVEEHLGEFEQAYDLFDDELSRRTFIGAINTKLTGDPSHILPNVEHDHLYFTKENFPEKRNEVMLDVGGFTGDSIVDFQKITNGEFDHIVSLEPFPKMFEQLNSTIKKLGIEDKCTTIQLGAWNEKTVLSFSNTEMDIDSKIKEDGDLKISVDTIDSILKDLGRTVTYMKFDINGAEYKAILGAENTIRNEKPFLATKMHVKEDFYRLPILLKQIAPDIKLQLRQRNYMSMMLVLYAFFDNN